MHPQRTVLIVDDFVRDLHRYVEFVRKLGYEAFGVNRFEDAQNLLRTKNFDFALVDMHLVEGSDSLQGLDILRELKDSGAPTVLVAMSSDPDIKVAEEARRCGAVEFLRKPLVSPDEIAIAFSLGRDRIQLRQTNQRLQEQASLPKSLAEKCPDGIVISPEHNQLVSVIAKSREIPVVILGETGTGKEEIAKLIHRRRCVTEGAIPFVSVNCANLNSGLSESLLFGHRKGAFSGADRHTVGYVGEADGGILFLDEIHTLSKESQQRLLRVLNDGRYTRLGDTLEMSAQFQVVVATTVDLDEEVAAGRFLLDLRTRLTGIDIYLKPLRERFADLPLLLSLFLARQQATCEPEEFEALVERCRSFYWQGNIRQLFKVLHSMVVMASLADSPLRAEQLPVFKTMHPPGSPSVLPSLPTPLGGHEGNDPVILDARQLFELSLRQDVDLQEVLQQVERAVIKASLLRHPRITDVYQGLGIGRNTLDVKRKRLGL